MYGYVILLFKSQIQYYTRYKILTTNKLNFINQMSACCSVSLTQIGVYLESSLVSTLLFSTTMNTASATNAIGYTTNGVYSKISFGELVLEIMRL